MSSSEIEFDVACDNDVETFIVDAKYQLIKRGIGPFHYALPRGIYKFKFRRGTSVVEQLCEIDTNGETISPSQELELQTAVPRARSTRSSPGQADMARRLSTERHLQDGEGSAIYLFARNDAAAAPRNPAAGFSLHTLHGELVADVAEVAVRDDPTCAALNIGVKPGAYRLRYAAADAEPIEQVIIASPEWQTQVFVLHDRMRGSATPQPPLATASVLMCRHDFDPDNPLLQLADAARVALGLDRAEMPRELLNNLLDDRFDNPMLGIYAAHAIAASNPDDPLLERVLGALESLVPGHPDVIALRLLPHAMIDMPPMLRSSWKRIVAASVDEELQLSLAPGSLASRLPASFVAGTPWLIWETAALLPEGQSQVVLEEVLGDVESIIGATAGVEDQPAQLGLTGWEEALYTYLRRRVSQRSREAGGLESLALPAPADARKIARAFGTTVGQVEATVSGLATKLRNLTATAE